MKWSPFVLLSVLALCPVAEAADRLANPGNFANQFAAAGPGDRILLAPGTYGHYWLANKHGAPDSLIEVVAQDPMNRPVFDLGGVSSEGIQIASCSYILFDGLVVRGATEEGIHLQSAGGPASHHIIMKNCSVTMPSTSGNTDNWKSDYTSDTLFYNCTAEVNGDCGFDFMGTTGGLIMRSTMIGGNCGIHAKNGSYNMGFYKNFFDNAGERNFQFGGNGLYNHHQIAMGNVLVGASPQSVVYTTARYDEFRYNTIRNLQPGGAVIRILNEGAATPPTGDNAFANNLIEYAGAAVAYPGSNTDPASFTFADNFWSKAPSLPAPETGGVVGNPGLDATWHPANPAARDYGAYAPDMETAWDAYTSRFAWAWSYARQYEPRAECGSYQVAPGGTVVFDGRGSYAGTSSYGDYSIDGYEWDLDGDGLFGDAVGATVAMGYDELAGMGLTEGPHDIGLRIRINNELGQVVYDEGWGTLTVVPEPSLTALLLLGAFACRRRR
ncbi:MAG TPA: right-handed parallel beta-helix repeat-containing protein [Phycisphaerae bacterium]|nr:right-handed parallel beta-helix repeat-containing protein [Phycisphaerae bacterium]